MGKANFTEDFKRDAVVQITERGSPVAEVAAWLGISKYSLYKWRKRYGKPASAARDDDQAAEVRRLKRELQRVMEERDILKKRPRTSPGMQSDVRGHRRASPAVFDLRHVSVPACPAQRLLRLAERPAEQARARRPTTDRVDPRGIERERQGLWLSQASRRSGGHGRELLSHPGCAADAACRHFGHRSVTDAAPANTEASHPSRSTTRSIAGLTRRRLIWPG